MTTRVTIKHESPEASHAIVVKQGEGTQQRIEPGQSAEFYVYGGGLTVEEVELETAQDAVALQSFSLAAIGQGITGDEPTEHPAAEPTEHNINTTESLERSAMQPVQVQASAAAPSEAEVVTQKYADGSMATGVAPLPEQSPVEQAVPTGGSAESAQAGE